MTNLKHIVITGASSGIGEALALNYAASGVLLSLTGRNKERLNAVAKRCEEKGAEVQNITLNVTQRHEMKVWLQQIDSENPVDLIIANAGISAGTGDSGDYENVAQIYDVTEVNVLGVLNTITPLQNKMIDRGFGQIALMSSLASYRGWSGAPTYCASKAFVKIFGQGLRGALRNKGVKVNIICPGFVTSRMTDMNEFPMPFKISAERAAKIIVHGIEKNKAHINFPLATLFLTWLFAKLPNKVIEFIMVKLPNKASM